MDVLRAQQALLERFSLRVEEEMGRYVARHCTATAPTGALPVIGGHARTGVPMRIMVPLSQLAAAGRGQAEVLENTR